MRLGLSKTTKLFQTAFSGKTEIQNETSLASSQRSLEAGFAVARAVVVLSVPLAVSQRSLGEGFIVMSASTLAALYSLYAAGIILAVVTLGRKPAPFVVVAIHLADIFWAFTFATVIDSFGPALLLLVFPLLTATLRWGPSATLATTLGLVGILQVTTPSSGIETDWHGYLMRIQTPASVVLLGVLFAHISHRHKQTSIAEGTHNVDSPLPSGTPGQIIETVFDQAFAAFKPKHIQLLVEEYNTGRTFLWHADASRPSAVVHSEEFDYSSAEPYLRLMPRGDWVLRRVGTQESLFTIDSGKIKPIQETIPVGFTEYFSKYATVVSVAIEMGDEWQGRFIVCEPAVKGSNKAIWRALRTFSETAARSILTAQVCLRACRDTAAEERARLARELHDGVIQSLLGVDLRLESLKRHAELSARDDLYEVQDVLRREAMGLRQLVNDSRRKALSPERLLEYVSDLLERFQRDTGVVTHFFADLDTDRMPARICHEIARITEECTVNTHKHSRASTLTVRVGSVANNWLIVVVDDGIGFDFRGVWSLERLSTAGVGPNVIKERVKALAGDLLIESTPSGSRIEITIPKTFSVSRDVFPRRLRSNAPELTSQETEAS